MLINIIFALTVVIILGALGYLFLDKLHRFKLEIVEQLANRHDTIRTTLDTHSLDIAKRLVLIDDAQRKLTDLSNNVLGLQEILADKKSRGAFGEIQLQNLIANLLPPSNYVMQQQLSNGLRCDCMLLLPPPTGNVAIDAKFPLENYQRYSDPETSEIERKRYMQIFNQDIKKHINDIADKYIIPGETANGAIMFIPAEAVFADIHSRFPDLVALAHSKSVWLTSPTTLMAIVTTASAVLKDNATREHIDCIQQHLRALAKDFTIFNERMIKLSKHIEAINTDAKQVHISADKITRRFAAIEKVEIQEEN